MWFPFLLYMNDVKLQQSVQSLRKQILCVCAASCWGTISPTRALQKITIHFSLLTRRSDIIQYYGNKLLPLLNISLKGKIAVHTLICTIGISIKLFSLQHPWWQMRTCINLIKDKCARKTLNIRVKNASLCHNLFSLFFNVRSEKAEKDAWNMTSQLISWRLNFLSFDLFNVCSSVAKTEQMRYDHTGCNQISFALKNGSVLFSKGHTSTLITALLWTLYSSPYKWFELMWLTGIHLQPVWVCDCSCSTACQTFHCNHSVTSVRKMLSCLVKTNSPLYRKQHLGLGKRSFSPSTHRHTDACTDVLL